MLYKTPKEPSLMVVAKEVAVEITNDKNIPAT